MTHTTALHTSLKPGQVFRFHIDRRTTLVVVKGTVMVNTPPSWLADRMLSGQTRLEEGQAFRPLLDGWAEVIAVGEAPVELMRYSQAGATLDTLWHRLSTALRQRMRAFRGVS